MYVFGNNVSRYFMWQFIGDLRQAIECKCSDVCITMYKSARVYIQEYVFYSNYFTSKAKITENKEIQGYVKHDANIKTCETKKHSYAKMEENETGMF